MFGPSSSLNITENVDMSQSSIDLPYTYNDWCHNVRSALTGELNSVPNEIVFNEIINKSNGESYKYRKENKAYYKKKWR